MDIKKKLRKTILYFNSEPIYINNEFELLELSSEIWDLGSKVLITQDLEQLQDFKAVVSDFSERELTILKLHKLLNKIDSLEKELEAKPKKRTTRKDTLQTSGLKNCIVPNNKLSNTMTNENLFNNQVSLVTLSGKAKDITTSCLVTYDEKHLAFQTSTPFTEYDRAVYNAVVSHYIAGNLVMTADMICRAMMGKSRTHPTDIQITSVIESMRKMSMIRVNLDLTDEFQKRKITLDDEFITSYKIETSLLLCSSISVTTKNKEIDAFIIKETPILYSYSHAVNQVITIPLDVLDTPSGNTATNIKIKNYLIRRIEGMKTNNKLKQNIIIIDTIYTLLETTTKQENERIRKQIIKILDYWIVKNYIKKYIFIKNGKTIHSIQIDV